MLPMSVPDGLWSPKSNHPLLFSTSVDQYQLVRLLFDTKGHQQEDVESNGGEDRKAGRNYQNVDWFLPLHQSR